MRKSLALLAAAVLSGWPAALDPDPAGYPREPAGFWKPSVYRELSGDSGDRRVALAVLALELGHELCSGMAEAVSGVREAARALEGALERLRENESNQEVTP